MTTVATHDCIVRASTARQVASLARDYFAPDCEVWGVDVTGFLNHVARLYESVARDSIMDDDFTYPPTVGGKDCTP